jgi:hypothetical protein
LLLLFIHLDSDLKGRKGLEYAKAVRFCSNFGVDEGKGFGSVTGWPQQHGSGLKKKHGMTHFICGSGDSILNQICSMGPDGTGAQSKKRQARLPMHALPELVVSISVLFLVIVIVLGAGQS